MPLSSSTVPFGANVPLSPVCQPFCVYTEDPMNERAVLPSISCQCHQVWQGRAHPFFHVIKPLYSLPPLTDESPLLHSRPTHGVERMSLCSPAVPLSHLLPSRQVARTSRSPWGCSDTTKLQSLSQKRLLPNNRGRNDAISSHSCLRLFLMMTSVTASNTNWTLLVSGTIVLGRGLYIRKFGRKLFSFCEGGEPHPTRARTRHVVGVGGAREVSVDFLRLSTLVDVTWRVLTSRDACWVSTRVHGSAHELRWVGLGWSYFSSAFFWRIWVKSVASTLRRRCGLNYITLASSDGFQNGAIFNVWTRFSLAI